MSDVEFDEVRSTNFSSERNQPKNFLISAGFVKSQRGANLLYLIILVLIIAGLILSISHLTNPNNSFPLPTTYAPTK
ncbi:MAG TPA: hypothetical protein VFA52_02310 [Candidatus Paceibacterota bacterium]|nr:hypothetical protein [Candidatus Paceibacterota bacterium]